MKDIAKEENNDDVISENVSTNQLSAVMRGGECFGQIFNDDHTVYSPLRQRSSWNTEQRLVAPVQGGLCHKALAVLCVPIQVGPVY
jgi:hypothetical protein